MIVYEVTKKIDQQGLGTNGWDCGPICLQNVESYLINVNLKNTDVDNYLDLNNQYASKDWIHAIRKKHIIISMGNTYVQQEIVFEISQDKNMCDTSHHLLANTSYEMLNQITTRNSGVNTEGTDLGKSTREDSNYNAMWWIATLNVRSLGNQKIKVNDNKFHNLPEYLHFFKSNNFKIIAIQETRVLGKCEQKRE